MGFSISWVAFQGLPKAEVLARTRLRDTGHLDEANEAPFSVADLPMGWVVLFSNDFSFGSAEHLNGLSTGATLISCQVHESIMFSATFCSVDGKDVWGVWHDGQKGGYDLTVSGRTPSQLGAIRDSLHSEQDRHGGVKSEVDFGFDIPVELAAAFTQYRHDRWKFAWGEPRFYVLERTR